MYVTYAALHTITPYHWEHLFFNSIKHGLSNHGHVRQDEAAGVYKKLVFTPDGTKLLGGILVGAPRLRAGRAVEIWSSPASHGASPSWMVDEHLKNG